MRLHGAVRSWSLSLYLLERPDLQVADHELLGSSQGRVPEGQGGRGAAAEQVAAHDDRVAAVSAAHRHEVVVRVHEAGVPVRPWEDPELRLVPQATEREHEGLAGAVEPPGARLPRRRREAAEDVRLGVLDHEDGAVVVGQVAEESGQGDAVGLRRVAQHPLHSAGQAQADGQVLRDALHERVGEKGPHLPLGPLRPQPEGRAPARLGLLRLGLLRLLQAAGLSSAGLPPVGRPVLQLRLVRQARLQLCQAVEARERNRRVALSSLSRLGVQVVQQQACDLVERLPLPHPEDDAPRALGVLGTVASPVQRPHVQLEVEGNAIILRALLLHGHRNGSAV
mmetsp:Transcript_86683/g.230313  ORF Transcript_86683/g.230313 Transcript_86683/m.230313 type:complete len:338 (+) Transcript_86683:31-1044(+)